MANAKRRLTPEQQREKMLSILTPVVSVLLALIVGAIIIAFLGKNPVQGYGAMLQGSLGDINKIVTAPFWGIRKHIRVSSIDSGVNTNANGQALDADGKVIDGLYCVGNVGGVFYGGADYPFHQTGLSLGRCYTFGMLAAKHAMGQL